LLPHFDTIRALLGNQITYGRRGTIKSLCRYIVDHIKAEAWWADSPENIQGENAVDAKAKDRWKT